MECLVVGNGIAGCVLTHQLRKRNKNVHMIAKAAPKSSQYAAGILNPTVLKRYTAVWKAHEFHAAAIPFYDNLEKTLAVPMWHALPIYRIFSTAAEQNAWMVAAGQKVLQNFLVPQLGTTSPSTALHAPFGYGLVQQVGRLEVPSLVAATKAALGQNYTNANFDYAQVQWVDDKPHYKGITYDHIFFCEGYNAHHNPFFDLSALTGNKGEMLRIKSHHLPEDAIWKGPLFICPLGALKFWIGASFDPKNKEASPSEEGKSWLLRQLAKMTSAPFEILSHNSGIRPTTKDRRPLLGTHTTLKRLHLLNGLGTRGVLMAPLLSEWLCDAIFKNSPLPSEVDWQRFAHLDSN